MRVDWCVSSWFRIKNTHSLTHLYLNGRCWHWGSLRGYIVTADGGITTGVSSSSESSSPASSRSALRSLRSSWLTLHAVNRRPIHPMFFYFSRSRAPDPDRIHDGFAAGFLGFLSFL